MAFLLSRFCLSSPVTAAAVFLSLAFCATQSAAKTPQQCVALGTAAIAKNVRITESQWVAGGETRVGRSIVSLPAHCQVKGKVNERTSAVDGKAYAIGFELRLPDEWNQRFLFQGNGGTDGIVVSAYGAFPNRSLPALSEGFAVVSSDAGHANDNSSLISGALFGHDPQARLDFGYDANRVLTPIAKQLIQTFYGEAPGRSYFMGCSNGGRHAMVAASRLAEEFDGFVAGNPGFNLPKAAIQHAWDIQALSAVNQDISQSLSKNDLALLSDAILARCDDLDGLKDGMVFNLSACQESFSVDTLQCADDATENCLSTAKVAALTKMFSGPVNSQSDALYSSWPFDAGVSGADWRRWKIQSPIANLPIIAALGTGALAKVFVTPPMELSPAPGDLLNYLRQFNFDKDAPKIYATNDTFTESAIGFMTPPDAEHFSSLVKASGKLLVTHGSSDGVFSVDDTIAWYNALNKNHNGKANQFARLFVVPGMNHCAGGPSTDQFDALAAIVKWVEQGTAPDTLVATVNSTNTELPKNWSLKRSRLLCTFPHVAFYRGAGDSEQAASFVCR